jgi:hypothetical protein
VHFQKRNVAFHSVFKTEIAKFERFLHSEIVMLNNLSKMIPDQIAPDCDFGLENRACKGTLRQLNLKLVKAFSIKPSLFDH